MRWLCTRAAGKKAFSVPQKNSVFLLSHSDNSVAETVLWLWVPEGGRVLGTNFLSLARAHENRFLHHAEGCITAYQFVLLSSLSFNLLVINFANRMIYGLCCFPTCFGVGVFKPPELMFCDSKFLDNY